MDDLSRTEIEELISQWVLSERDRAIMHRRLIDGITFDKLSEEFDLSVRWVKEIVYKQKRKIEKHVK